MALRARHPENTDVELSLHGHSYGSQSRGHLSRTMSHEDSPILGWEQGHTFAPRTHPGFLVLGWICRSSETINKAFSLIPLSPTPNCYFVPMAK